MRSSFTAALLAIGLLFLPPHLPAQFNSFLEGPSGSRIGVVLRDIDADRAAALKLGSVTGVDVVMVEPGSPAEQAGIKAGDVLLSYNSESIVGAQQLGRLVAETPVGRKVKIEYFRDGKVGTVMVTTALRPSSGSLTLNGINFPGWNDALMPGSVPNARVSWTNYQLGIECEGLDSHNSQLADYFGVKHGILIRSVAKESAAAKAGLRAGDVIMQIGSHTVVDPKDITYYLRQEERVSKPLTLEVMREHKPSTLKLSLSPDSQQ